jgi:hypothetical protein
MIQEGSEGFGFSSGLFSPALQQQLLVAAQLVPLLRGGCRSICCRVQFCQHILLMHKPVPRQRCPAIILYRHWHTPAVLNDPASKLRLQALPGAQCGKH